MALGQGGAGATLVVVDQLEEVFTLCRDPGEREALLEGLRHAVSVPDGRIWVVVAMRADFYPRLVECPDFAALAVSEQHLVCPLEPEQLRRAIEGPAALAGLELAPGLVRRLLDDLAERPGTLPLLQHLLYELWLNRRGRELTLEAYSTSGGLEGALAKRANGVYGALSPAEQELARHVLLRLTQPGRDRGHPPAGHVRRLGSRAGRARGARGGARRPRRRAPHHARP